MSPPSNKTVPLTHTGDGTVIFSVPFLSQTSPKGLTLQTQRSEHLRGDRILKTPLWLELLKMGGNLQNLLKKNGSFYVELLQEGFLQNGAITLIGLMPKPRSPSSNMPDGQKNIFKTVIQLDGDIICQIDRAVLKEKHATELIEGYIRVQHQFLEGFRKTLGAIRFLIIANLTIWIPALYLIWKYLQ